MTDWAAQLRQAEAQGLRRRERLVGYRYQDGRFTFQWAPIRRTKEPPAEPPRVGRGVQGKLI